MQGVIDIVSCEKREWLQYIENAIVIATRKHFEVTNMYKLFCHRKCTVAAAYNLSVHVLQRIMLCRKYYMEIICQAITP